MFGDVFFPAGQLLASSGVGGQKAFVDIPLAGGMRRSKVAENNKALPMDRVYFMYNHFHNAWTTQTSALGPFAESHVDRYTFGIEKTFFDDCWSVEARMPFSHRFRFDNNNLAFPFDIEGGEIGNLSVYLKALLWASEQTAVVAGLGADFPTGSSVTGTFTSGLGSLDTYRVNNDAYHLLPYLGVLSVPRDNLFFHGFAQLDIAANGNRVQVVDIAAATPFSGVLTEQNLLHLDVSAGRWFYRNPNARYLSALAGLVELHYTTTLQDADIIAATIPDILPRDYRFGNTYNRMDVLNLTIGLDAEVGLTNVRVGAVFPLSDGTNQVFDSEIQVQINRRF
jgi:hypothetical protein